MVKKNFILTVFSIVLSGLISAQSLFTAKSGNVSFTSDAPLELIQARSVKMSGILKVTDRSFAFSLPVSSFEGFNSSLQRTHFNENYLETEKFPLATFEGKIIEDIDLTQPGKYEVRGKGRFTVHGVEQVRIIKCTVLVSKNKIEITSQFSVMLEDHNIKIPTVVSKKIAREIQVEIAITLHSKV